MEKIYLDVFSVKVNSKQRALKVFMNTFYGEAGNKISPVFVLAIALKVTTTGKEKIQMVAKIVQDLGFEMTGERGECDEDGCRLYYGDSVTGDTPLTILQNGIIRICSIAQLFAEGNASLYPQFKPDDKTMRHKNKSILNNDTYVWTNKWSKINNKLMSTSGIIPCK